MSTFNLEQGIQELLETRPNEEKPKRRRRQKHKDLFKHARRGDFTLPDNVVLDIVGNDLYREIEYVKWKFQTQYIHVDKIFNAHTLVPFIALEYNVYPEHIHLVLNHDTGYHNVYVIYHKVTLKYYNTYKKYLFSQSAKWHLAQNDPILDFDHDFYKYEDIKDQIIKVLGQLPNRRNLNQTLVRDFNVNYERLFDIDHEGRYENYRRAMKLRDTSNIYQKTQPVYKGDYLGSKRRLINHLNQNSRDNLPLNHDSTALSCDFEIQSDNYIYEWHY